MEEPSLMKLVLEVDDELLQIGVEPFERPFHARLIIAKRLAAGGAIPLDSSLLQAVDQIYSEIYRPSDLHMPPIYVGAFMFRDVFFPLRIPIIYGSPEINPVDFLADVPETLKRWLFTDRQTGLTFFDQVIDTMDFVYGLDDLEVTDHVPERTMEWWELAKRQLEAAAAAVLGSFDKYAIIQNCCISIELLLKGALIAKDDSYKELTKGEVDKRLRDNYGHNPLDIANTLPDFLPGLSKDALASVVNYSVTKKFELVKRRYDFQQYSRQELGTLLMNAQFVSGEILRQFSDRNFRLELNRTPDEDWNLTHRTFPEKQTEATGKPTVTTQLEQLSKLYQEDGTKRTPAVSLKGRRAFELSDYAVSREGIYEDHD